MKTAWKVIRGILIVASTIVLSTIAINATDNAGNFSDSLLGLVIGVGEESCPENMILVPEAEGGFCLDIFEASAGGNCQFKNPQNQNETRMNLEKASCQAKSIEDALPWTNVARHQAELACAQAGKRLPKNNEWYKAALGTPDSKGNVARGDCNVNSAGTPMKTGTQDFCVSSHGVYDMVGNVWEWVDETVSNGSYKGRKLPDGGYVSGIDNEGVPIDTSSTTPDLNFNEDYFSIDHSQTRGMIRGGYWGSGTDAGQYAVNAITPPSFTGNAVGFRCAK